MAGGGLCEECILASKEPRCVLWSWGLWGFLAGQQQDQICIGGNSSGHDGRKVWRDTEQRRETRPEQGHRPEDRDKTGGETQNRRGTPDWRRETRLEVHAEACSRMQGRVPKETYPLGAPEVALMEGQRGEGRNG